MDKKIKQIFLLLVLIQGLHSIEEFIGKLWESFPPATYLCSLVSDNLETGFLIINIGLFVFGLWCWAFPVRRGYRYVELLMGFWIIIEFLNGVVHPIWSIIQRAYTPGLITAPILLVVSIVLLKKLRLNNRT